MLVKFLKGNQPLVLAFILLLAGGLWVLSFINPIGMIIPSDSYIMPFAEFFNNLISLNSRASVVISFLIVIIQALFLIQFNKRFIVINQRTYLPAFFYILLTSAFVPLQRINPVILGLPFIYMSVFFIFSVYRKEFALNRLYLATLCISIASLFWAPFSVFFVLFIVSLIILRPFVGREWIVGLLGFLTPFLFTFVYFFVFNESNFNELLNTIRNSFFIGKHFNLLHHSYYIFYGLILLSIIAASLTIVKNFQKKKIMVRKFFAFNWWFFIVFILAFVLMQVIGYEVIFVLAIPVSFLLADYCYMVKRERILSILILLLIISASYIQTIAHFLVSY